MATYFRFQDILINNQGIAMAGANVYVVTQPLTTVLGVIPPTPLATIYSSSSGAALVQPVVVDGNGNYFFYAPQGSYTLYFHDPFGRIPDSFLIDIQVLSPGGGTVTSVAMTIPDGFAITGSPVTSSGTLALAYSTDWLANTFIAGPTSGSAGAPTRRTLNANDVAGLGFGTVSSVAATITGSALLSLAVSGSPITASGTLAFTVNFQNQNANLVLASPTSGGAGAITARSLVGADLPNPSATTLGGVQSYAAVSHQWINAISTSGVPSSTQPAASDLSNGTTGSGLVVLATQPTVTLPKWQSYTVATLPVGTEGQYAYATNGRKVGEAAGFGSGVPVYWSNDQGGSPPSSAGWHVFSTDALVQA